VERALSRLRSAESNLIGTKAAEAIAAASKPLRLENAVGRFYRPELDALRFFAFVLVFLGHTIPLKGDSPRWLVALRAAGWFGVPVFFCLSAYLITELLFREKHAVGSINIPAFYKRRILRIWPLYFFVLLAGFGFSHFTDLPMPISGLAAYSLLMGNWYSVLGGVVAIGIGHLWSITVEEQFYLVWPSMVSHLSRRNVGKASIIMWCLSQASLLVLCARGGALPMIWRNSLTQVQYFALGIGLSVGLKGGTFRFRRMIRFGFAATGVGILFLSNFLFGTLIYTDLASMSRTCPGYIIAGIGTLLIVAAFLGSGIGEVKGLRYLGKISYGLYIYHPSCILIAVFLARLFMRQRIVIAAIGIGFPLTVVVASVSYRFLETPFLRLKERFEIVKSRTV
jgi:peptidoglycan/LPS O-acetylase OafA/YrhL